MAPSSSELADTIEAVLSEPIDAPSLFIGRDSLALIAAALRLKPRVAELLRRIEWGDQGHCPVDFEDGECEASFYSKNQHDHRPDCPLAAMLKECVE